MAQARWAWMIGIILLMAPHAAVFGEDRLSDQNQGTREVVSGTLIKLDLSSMKGLVETDLGRPVFFEITKPHLFENLSPGDRVTVELDNHGQANKVIGASVPEFLSPDYQEPADESPMPVG